MAPLSLFWILLLQFCTTLTYKCNGLNFSNIPAIFVFGDSAVDTGNNDYINTIFKANFAPYGMNYPGHIATGRYSDGKLIPDILVSSQSQGIKNAVPPFLQPYLSEDELRTGVCFASAGAGWDDETTALSGAIPMSKQPELFREYIQRLKRIVGENEAERIIRQAVVMIHAGTVDFTMNFYILRSNRKMEYTISEYQDFLQYNMQQFLKELYDLGCRKMVLSGLPPMGCMPIVKTASGLPLLRTCLEDKNSDAQSYNEKMVKLLPRVQAKLPGSKILYADAYNPLMDMINNPSKYGFVETARGCCGTGLVEGNALCNPLTPVCRNPSQHIFFDSMHPTEAVYRYLSDYLLKNLGQQLAE